MNSDDIDIIERTAVYRGYTRLDRYRLRHRLFDGGWSGEMSRELLVRGNAVCVLPYDPARDAVVLIEQFRVGALAAGLPPWQTEIVAGVVEAGESDADVARREIVEECGCTAIELHPVCRALSSSGILSEVATVFCATVDASAATGTHGLTEEHEDIRATVRPFDAAYALIESGGIQHCQGIVALQWLAINRARLRAD